MLFVCLLCLLPSCSYYPNSTFVIKRPFILTHKNVWHKCNFCCAEANVWSTDQLVPRSRLKWDWSDAWILLCPSSKGSKWPAGSSHTFTVSPGLNGVGLINQPHEYRMAEQTLILPWQVLISIPRVTESSFIFTSSNKSLPWRRQCWAPFVSQPHPKVKPSRFWNSLKMTVLIKIFRFYSLSPFPGRRIYIPGRECANLLRLLPETVSVGQSPTLPAKKSWKCFLFAPLDLLPVPFLLLSLRGKTTAKPKLPSTLSSIAHLLNIFLHLHPVSALCEANSSL